MSEFNGLQVMHDGKDAFLHFACVFCAEDDHFHALKVDFHRGGGAHALGETVGGELSSVVNDEIRFAELL